MKNPDRYLFPAVFTYEADGTISITYPDLPGCTSAASDDAEALASAREALGVQLWRIEQEGGEIPTATPLVAISVQPNERAVPVDVYMPAIRMARETRSVTRTVTLPAWLNAAALERGENFSQVLQAALIERMGMDRPPHV